MTTGSEASAPLPFRNRSRRADLDRYSRFIRTTRILLVAAAAILLATIAVLASLNPFGSLQTIADIDVSRFASGQEMTNPQFSGVTLQGDAYSMSAKRARLDAPIPNSLHLDSPRIEIDFRDGRKLRASARSASLDVGKRSTVLEGGVRIWTSDEFVATTQKILVDFRTGRAISPLSVSAMAPFGSIEAGSMAAYRDSGGARGDSTSVLKFERGVKVVIRPGKQGRQ